MTERARFTLALGAVAVGAALFAILFRGSVLLLYRHGYGADNIVQAIGSLAPPLRLWVPAVGGLLAGVIASVRSSSRQGVSNVMEAVVLGNVRLSLVSTLIRSASSWAAIVTGLSIGREGPLIEFAGSLGATAGRLARLSLDRTRILVAAGTAAGFAAAYNTPFAAILFVLETIMGIVALEALLPAIAAAVVATALTRAAVGGGPIYGQRAFAIQSSWELLFFGALGVIAVCGAVAFKRALRAFESWFERRTLPQPWRSGLGGLIVGVIAVALPQVAGNGYETLNDILNQPLAWQFLIMLAVAKVAATSSSVASGVPGGIFTPVLLLGGAMGSLWGQALVHVGLAPAASVGSYALVGMAATTAASIHAPLTAAVLVFELSGDYPIVLPLLVATVVATTLSRAWGSESVYETELKRKGIGWELTLDGRRVTTP